MRVPDFGLKTALLATGRDSVPATYRDGSLLGYVGPEPRLSARLADIDPKVPALLVAVEDRRFWNHAGIDMRALARALWVDAKARAALQGGSTLTQQLLKNTLLAKSRKWNRKLLELPLAPAVESLLGKPWVIEHYLNTVYVGGGVYGIRSASLNFLGKEPQHLSWSEAALLAGLPAAPEAYAFWRLNPLAARRREFVLRRGRDAGVMSAGELEAALAEAMPKRRMACSATRDLLSRIPTPAGLTVAETTLDREVHLAACRVARRAAGTGYCAIAAVEVGTGDIRALATRWADPFGGFDVALTGAMSPGSALKPFVLASALDAGYELGHIFPSGTVELSIDGKAWRVENWRGASYGLSTLAEATLNSDNTVYARLIGEIGHESVARVLSSVGLPASPSPGPALALGVLNAGVSPVQMAASYATLTGRDFFNPNLTAGVAGVPVRQLVSVEARAHVREVLQELVRTQVSAPLARAGAFGKTGTPDDGLSGWFVGVHDGLATAVVVSGDAEERPLKARLAAAAWEAFYEELRRVRPRPR